ncbi:MAG: Asp/Glu racemase [Gammaproteobacteria bacterium]|nr:Asp/Glu racemase [Gammaproteobacteria bacterium]
MSKQKFRIGQIVPSSNVTMETEIPALLRAREGVEPERFTFHSARMRMKNVTKEELEAMDAESDRCALELSDAAVDVMGYACLVAIMSMGKGYHRESERRLSEVARDNGHPCPVVSSAGALVEGLKVLGAKRISVLAPYMKPLTKLVTDYIEHEGIEVVDVISLEIPNNLDVAAQDPRQPAEVCKKLNVKNADVVVVSACVQMPSLPSIEPVEKHFGLPAVSASVCTTFQMLDRLGLKTVAPGGGTLLSGAYGKAKAA